MDKKAGCCRIVSPILALATSTQSNHEPPPCPGPVDGCFRFEAINGRRLGWTARGAPEVGRVAFSGDGFGPVGCGNPSFARIKPHESFGISQPGRHGKAGAHEAGMGASPTRGHRGIPERHRSPARAGASPPVKVTKISRARVEKIGRLVFMVYLVLTILVWKFLTGNQRTLT